MKTRTPNSATLKVLSPTQRLKNASPISNKRPNITLALNYQSQNNSIVRASPTSITHQSQNLGFDVIGQKGDLKIDAFLPGKFPRTCLLSFGHSGLNTDLYRKILQKIVQQGSECQLSILQYNSDKFLDVLSQTQSILSISEIENARKESISCSDDIETALTKASGYQTSHLLLRIEKPSTRHQLLIIDLAMRQKINTITANRETIERAKTINASLSALNNVILTFSRGSDHIPFRESHLTRLIQKYFSRESSISFLFNCCGGEEETGNSLKLAKLLQGIGRPQKKQVDQNFLKKVISMQSQSKERFNLTISRHRKEIADWSSAEENTLARQSQLTQSTSKKQTRKLKITVEKLEKSIRLNERRICNSVLDSNKENNPQSNNKSQIQSIQTNRLLIRHLKSMQVRHTCLRQKTLIKTDLFKLQCEQSKGMSSILDTLTRTCDEHINGLSPDSDRSVRNLIQFQNQALAAKLAHQCFKNRILQHKQVSKSFEKSLCENISYGRGLIGKDEDTSEIEKRLKNRIEEKRRGIEYLQRVMQDTVENYEKLAEMQRYKNIQTISCIYPNQILICMK